MEIGVKKIEVSSGDEINIYFIGDIHEGNCNCNIPALKQAVKIVNDDPSGYWIGMGDYIEAITHLGDKRFDPLSIMQNYSIRDLKDLPMKQMQNVFSVLKPIQSKCLALVIGNHEASYIQHNSSDIYDRFVNMFKTSAHEENKPPFKLGYVGFYKIQLKPTWKESSATSITLALNHGESGGGYLEGYKINKVHQLFKYMYADINVMAHIHQLGKDVKHVVGVTQYNKLKKKKRYWGISGCFLNSYVEGNTNYFESKAGKGGESDIGMLKAGIKINTKHNHLDWDCKMEEIYL